MLTDVYPRSVQRMFDLFIYQPVQRCTGFLGEMNNLKLELARQLYLNANAARTITSWNHLPTWIQEGYMNHVR